MAKTSAAPSGDKAAKPKSSSAPKSDAKAKPKDDKKGKEKAAEPAAEAPKKAPEPPRPPADPRLKVLKKFHGKFLPKGPLRERHKSLMGRWSSGEDHGGVTLDELSTLLKDWRASREKPVKKSAVKV